VTHELTDLLEEARQRGFLGPGPVEPHLDHARAFVVAAQDAPERAVDLGAGGGLPGLVLAVEFWPEAEWVFLDAQQKRTLFLQEAIEELDLEDRVQVVTQRAEEFGRDERKTGSPAEWDRRSRRSRSPQPGEEVASAESQGSTQSLSKGG
jgi:predicted O-methyltransferase YrrM